MNFLMIAIYSYMQSVRISSPLIETYHFALLSATCLLHPALVSLDLFLDFGAVAVITVLFLLNALFSHRLLHDGIVSHVDRVTLTDFFHSCDGTFLANCKRHLLAVFDLRLHEPLLVRRCYEKWYVHVLINTQYNVRNQQVIRLEKVTYFGALRAELVTFMDKLVGAKFVLQPSGSHLVGLHCLNIPVYVLVFAHEWLENHVLFAISSAASRFLFAAAAAFDHDLLPLLELGLQARFKFLHLPLLLPYPPRFALCPNYRFFLYRVSTEELIAPGLVHLAKGLLRCISLVEEGPNAEVYRLTVVMVRHIFVLVTVVPPLFFLI